MRTDAGRGKTTRTAGDTRTTTTTNGDGEDNEGEGGRTKRDNINISKIKNIYYSTTEVNKVIVSSVVL